LAVRAKKRISASRIADNIRRRKIRTRGARPRPVQNGGLTGPRVGHGENIYASTGNMVEPSDAVDSWMLEKNQYDYNQDGFASAGHYTQVVWRASVRIGCAIVNCPNARFDNTVLCDYAPRGKSRTEASRAARALRP
jgi:hypothetical protein